MRWPIPPSPAAARSPISPSRIAGSATLVQLRDKHGSTRAMLAEARALIDVWRRSTFRC